MRTVAALSATFSMSWRMAAMAGLTPTSRASWGGDFMRWRMMIQLLFYNFQLLF